MSVDLTNLHSFQLPAKAKELIQLSQPEQVQLLADVERYVVVAGGSNTIFVDDFDGTIVQPSFYGINSTELDDAYQVTVGASENWHHLVSSLLSQNIRGFENLALIPGTVGAAPVQNIGAYGVEVGDFVDKVTGVRLDDHTPFELCQDECLFGYRESVFKRHPGRYLITSVRFRLPKAWQPNVSYPALHELGQDVDAYTVFNKVIEIRKSKLPDPVLTPNAGSFFKNPIINEQHLSALKKQWPAIVSFTTDAGVKLAAGWMIDQLGFKGKSVGGAKVHDQQALVLTNAGHASGSELLALCRQIQQAVVSHFGVWLEPEVRLIGKEGLMSLANEQDSDNE